MEIFIPLSSDKKIQMLILKKKVINMSFKNVRFTIIALKLIKGKLAVN